MSLWWFLHNVRYQRKTTIFSDFYRMTKNQHIDITAEPFAKGGERACYQHPYDENKVIKIRLGELNKQTRRELAIYKSFAQRNMTNFQHVPRYYGKVETNLGQGMVFDLIRDFDGSISEPLYHFFLSGSPISEFLPQLEVLKKHLLDNLIVISADIVGRRNILLQKLSPTDAKLVIVDGIGNHTAINWLDNFRYFGRKKISRRWDRLYISLEQCANGER